MPYVDGVFYELYRNNGTAVVKRIAKSNKQDVIKIPPAIQNCKVIVIDANAFYNAKYLKEVHLGSNIFLIKKNAFQNCPQLRLVSIGNKKVSVEDCAFSGCFSLEKMESSTWKSIIEIKGQSVFAHCNKVNFENIEFVGEIQTHTFYECNKLSTLFFSHGSVLKNNAIQHCPALKRIYVDGSVDVSKGMLKKLKQYTLVCNETSTITDLAYSGYCIEYDDSFLPF